MVTDLKIPFKFLDPYKKDDIKFYFGREDDATALYEMVQKNRIVLVYGPSGTGKTSLIQCGLANKFNAADWIPFYIRRKENINHSLIDILRDFFPQDKTPSPDQDELNTIRKRIFTSKSRAGTSRSFFSEIGISFTDEEIKSFEKPGTGEISPEIEAGVSKLVFYLLQIAEKSLRPIYLVFDQLEELLMYGSPEEKSLFIESLKVITTTKRLISCHVIIILREEFFAVFDKFEREIPGITDRRMRVDPLQERDIKDVILKTLTYEPFHIKLEDPAHNIDDIFNALADKKGEVSLPYLQVYLDQLWREDFARDYPNGYEGTDFAPLTFTTREIRDFGQIKDVLQKFLTGRKAKIADKLKVKFPDIAPDFIDRVLKEFVSDYGTKLPILYNFVKEEYIFPEITRKFFHDFPPAPLQYVIKKLEKNKLIRKEPKTLELSHDILAKVIDEQRDARERKRIRIRVLIKDYMKERGSSLSLKEVREWQNEIYNCELNKEELDFYHESRRTRIAEESDEEWKKRAKESDEEWKKRVKARGYRWTLIILGVVVAAGVLLSLAYFKTRRFAYKYYALNFFNSRAAAIPDKMDAMKLGYYIYNKTSGVDEETKEQVEDFMIRLAADTSIQNSLSIHSLTLLSDKLFVPGITLDISGDGRFFCVEYDSLKNGTAAGKYRVYRTGTQDTIAQFNSVYYAYFINHSDKLLLAVATDSLSRKLGYPNSIVMLDCNKAPSDKGKTVFTSVGSVLNISDINTSRYSDFDSYDIRATHSGNLMVPYIDLNDRSSSHKVVFLGKDGRRLNAPIETYYSISNSRDNTLFMVGASGKTDGVTLKLFDEKGQKVGPSYPHVQWADFTPDNAILYLSNGTLYLANAPYTPGAFAVRYATPIDPRRFKYAYSVADGTIALVETHDKGVILYNFTDTALNRVYPEELVGVRHAENAMITLPHVHTGPGAGWDTVIHKRSFLRRGDNIMSSAGFSTNIVKTLFNVKRGWVAVETEPDPRIGNSFVYVLDSTLRKTGSFGITPNDSYVFSNDGNYFLLIRDRQLNVFDLRKPMRDLSNFGNILDWMKGITNDSVTEALRNKYDIHFPSLNLFQTH